MKLVLIILGMIFLHIIDDYNLQGWLASAKQKKYWEDNAPDKLYKYDYLMALFMHSFSWSFCIMLIPFICYWFMGKNMVIPFIYFLINLGFHFYVDDLKANKHKINLVEDQIFHMIQIVGTALGLFL